jgi:ribosomal protein L11 methyltransferase
VRVFPALDVTFVAEQRSLIDRVTARLDDFALSAVHETGSDESPVWRVFFASTAQRDAARRELGSEFGHAGLVLKAIDVPDEGWAEKSQAGLRAIRVASVIVAPPWDVPLVAPETVTVVIKPSMAFGTGHHETTRLCLALLQQVQLRDRRVLDVGTGSGVLALAAAARGAREVLGIDTDADAVACARENLGLNAGLPGVTFAEADARSLAQPADIVTANLTAALLAQIADRLLASTAPGGALVLSGFERGDIDALVDRFSPPAHVVALSCEGDWAAVLLRVP